MDSPPKRGLVSSEDLHFYGTTKVLLKSRKMVFGTHRNQQFWPNKGYGRSTRSCGSFYCHRNFYFLPKSSTRRKSRFLFVIETARAFTLVGETRWPAPGE